MSQYRIPRFRFPFSYYRLSHPSTQGGDIQIPNMVVNAATAGHGLAHPLEMAEVVMEVADIAWSAYEIRREHKHSHVEDNKKDEKESEEDEGDISKLRAENRRLRNVLEENVNLLQRLSKSPGLSNNCPPDLHVRLVSSINSASFLSKLEVLHEQSTATSDSPYTYQEAKGTDLKSVDILVYDDHGESSWWVWVNEDLGLDKMEEISGIDSENYVIICEDHVVDGIAGFIAKCILANPKSEKLSSDELQKAISKSLGRKDRSFWKNVWFAGKLFYALSTWGIFFAGFYRHQAIVKAAARGITSSGKLAMKAF